MTLPPFRRIAVATDFAATSDSAVALAMSLAKCCAAELTVVHVVEPAPYTQIGADTDTLAAIARQALDAAVVRVRDDVPNARGVLVVGRPADAVVAFVEEADVDLLVTGTHGRTSVARWMLGSVAERIVRASRSHVLTVHHDRAVDGSGEPTDDDVSALQQRPQGPFRRLLVATDFGATSDRAVALGAQLAAKTGARITLLHVVADDTPEYARVLVDADSRRRAVDAQMTRARAALGDIAATLPDLAPGAGLVVCHGSPAEEIAKAASEGSYDLVIVGTHGKVGLARWLLGSVAEKIVRSCEPPVLTVR